jgi:uroporphyrinogen-III synthase
LLESSEIKQKKTVLSFRPDDKTIPTLDGYHMINIPIERTFCSDITNVDVSSYQAIAFMSEKAVNCFKLEIPDSAKVYAVGPETASVLRSRGIDPILPETFDSGSLAEKIIKDNIKSLIVIRSDKGNDYLKNALWNRIIYSEVHAYRIEIDQTNLERAKKELQQCNADIVVLTSAEIARAVSNYISQECNYLIISIGPFTTKALRKEVKIIESKEHSIEGIMKLLKSLR